MALRFRRGLDIERQAVVFVEGEPTYTTDNKEFFIGDGVTPGGIQIGGINNLIDDSAPRLGGDLDLNNNNLIGSGNITINGDLKITGSIDVGLITANYTGSLFADDSSLIVDAINRRVFADVMALDGTTLIDSTSGEFDLSSTSLEALKDVEYNNTDPGAILTFNGSNFILDVLGATPGQTVQDGQLLQYDNTAGWVASSQIRLADSSILIDLVTGHIDLSNTMLDGHEDTHIANLVVDDVLSWDGVNWTNKQISIDNASITLDSLDDTVISNPNINDVLSWDGVNWTNNAIDLVSMIDELDDVVMGNDLQIGDVLSWDGVNWTNNNSTNTISMIDELDDVVTGNNLQIGDLLSWDGVNWTNNAIDLVSIIDELDDVVMGNDLQIGDILSWDGVNWTNITNNSSPMIDELDDVVMGNDLTIGDVLSWDGVNWTNNATTIALNDLTDVLVDSILQVGDVLTYDGINWIPEPVKIDMLQGDVLSVDSSIIVDSVNNTITANQITVETINSTNFTDTNAPDIGFMFDRDSSVNGGRPKLKVNRILADDTGVPALTGSLEFTDIVNGVEKRYAAMLAGQNRIMCFHQPDGATNQEYNQISVYSDSNLPSTEWARLGIGTFTPTEKLEVVGNAKVSGFVQFGSLTAIERDALTAANGMVIYNTDTNKFQGHANGVWVDLH